MRVSCFEGDHLAVVYYKYTHIYVHMNSVTSCRACGSGVHAVYVLMDTRIDIHMCDTRIDIHRCIMHL